MFCCRPHRARARARRQPPDGCWGHPSLHPACTQPKRSQPAFPVPALLVKVPQLYPHYLSCWARLASGGWGRAGSTYPCSPGWAQDFPAATSPVTWGLGLSGPLTTLGYRSRTQTGPLGEESGAQRGFLVRSQAAQDGADRTQASSPPVGALSDAHQPAGHLQGHVGTHRPTGGQLGVGLRITQVGLWTCGRGEGGLGSFREWQGPGVEGPATFSRKHFLSPCVPRGSWPAPS